MFLTPTLSIFGAEKTLDATSNEKLQDSFIEILTSLNDSQQQAFASSMATIGVIFTQKYGEKDSFQKYIEAVNGKTAQEIIALAKSISPQIKGMAERIDGSSLESFNKTVGQIMITLPLDKQKAFSVAIAKIMYNSEKKNEKKEIMAKSLNGMTATDVIALATTISAPFADADETDIRLSPLSEKEIKEHNISPIKQEQNEKIPLSKSLVPRE